MSSGRFVVYKSSAGSGKTYTLVREYLRLVLGHENPQYFRHILAVTFTNKAANEMKERVLESLETLASKPEEPRYNAVYLEDLAQATALDPGTVSCRAAAVLEEMLHHYSDLGINTIDKFVHRVVRTFARDLRIPVDFDVELDSDHLLTKAIDLLIHKVGSDLQLTQTLVEFAENKAREDKNWHIEKDLHRFARSLLREESEPSLNVLRAMPPHAFRSVRENIRQKLEFFQHQVRQMGQKPLDLIDKTGVPRSSFAGGEKRGLPNYFRVLAEFEETKLFPPSKTVLNAIDNDKWAAARASGEDREAIDSIRDDLFALYTKALEFLEKNLPEYRLYQLISEHLYATSVLNELDTIIAQVKEEVNILLISDFNKTISNIVLNEPAPFIYERLGERYHHYLIDEFQDTSVMQWQNLLPLVENSLAFSHFNLVVGDGKQAIYRWRGGEVEQFARLPEIHHHNNPHMLEKQHILQANYEEQQLNTNYRSQKEVVHFNNELFRIFNAELAPEYQTIYDGMEQEILEGRSGGYVQACLLEFSEDASPEETYLNALTKAIRSVKEDGFALHDIAVLTRNNRHGSLIAEHLMAEGIEVISSESLLLSSSPEVAFLMAFFQLIKDPGDNCAKATIVRYLTEERHREKAFHELISEHAHAIDTEHHRVFVNLYALLETLGYSLKLWQLARQPIYQTAEDLIRIFRLNKEPDAYLQFYLDAVHHYAQRFGNNVVEFLEWWTAQKSKLSVQVPEGAEAVNILTIHKSKGLQYPVVMVPFVNWRITPSKDSLWVDLKDQVEGLDVALLPTHKALEQTEYAHLFLEEKNKSFLDNMNLLYVALTRAEERLYLFSETTTNRSNIAHHFAATLVQMKGWNPDKMGVFRGVPEAPARVQKTSHAVYTLKEFPSCNWHGKLAISYQSPGMWEGKPAASGNLNALIRTAMCRMTHASDLPSVSMKMLHEGLLSEKEKEALEKRLTQLLATGTITSIFGQDQEIRIHPELLTKDGQNIQPDRITTDGRSATITCFRNKEGTDEARDILRKANQILLEMEYAPVKGYLFHLEAGKVELVSD